MERLLTAILSESGSLGALLRAAFLGLLLVALGGLALMRPRRSPNLLALFYGLLFAALLLHQACWQMTGFQSAPFRALVNTYDPRPADTSRTMITRGMIFDCKGRILAAPVAGRRRARQTALGPASFHPLGYNKAGIEYVMDPLLGGLAPPPDQDAERPHQTLRRMLLEPPAAQGADITLTLDLNLQRTGYELLKGRRGAIVALDPRTGAIRALVSSPGVDMQRFAQTANSPDNPQLNRALRGRYAPGSTFKIVIAALALEAGKTPELEAPAEGYTPSRGTPPIRDSEYYAALRKNRAWPGWGKIDLPAAFLHSSNAYFARLGVEHLPFPLLLAAARRLRLTESLTLAACGDRTLSTLPGALPDLTQNQRGMAHISIGQGALELTPLHVALFTAAIARGGELFEPRLLAGAPPASTRVWQASTAQKVTAMMRRAVVEGTGKGADIPGLEVCGKTGTAQTGRDSDNSWFTCFAPRKNPKLVITVIVEEGGFGAAEALPVAKDMLLKAQSLRYL